MSLKSKISRSLAQSVFLLTDFIFNLAMLKKYKKHLLSTWHTPEKRKAIDNFCYRLLIPAWLQYEYWKETDPDARVIKQKLLMGGDSGAAWALSYNERPFPPKKLNEHSFMTFDEACPMFKKLYELCQSYTNKNSQQILYIFQLGCSSGREIAWLAKNFSQHKFFGTDIYESVVDFASTHHNYLNLKFFMLSAKDFTQAIEVLENKEIVIFSSGSAQYVQPEHLDLFFKLCQKNRNKIRIYLDEPVETAIKANQLRGSAIRGNLSYTHDYRYYAEKNHLRIIESKVIAPYSEDSPLANSSHFHLECSNV